jgi:hypothetical protein
MNGESKAGSSTISLEWLQCARRGFRRLHRQKKTEEEEEEGLYFVSLGAQETNAFIIVKNGLVPLTLNYQPRLYFLKSGIFYEYSLCDRSNMIISFIN